MLSILSTPYYYCSMKTNIRPLQLAFILVLGKIALHLATANNLGFQRDEFLYLALGQHLDWGYWSNPPFIGAISWLSQDLGVEGPLRWEGGKLHALPQDYADMLGWTELAAAADRALAQAGDPNNCIIYGENYGQAGTIDHYCPKPHPTVVSFSDSYRLWAPDTLAPNVNTFIYINDELGDDVKDLFQDIQPMGGITDTLAREFGTTVYLCRQPKRSFPEFWVARMREVKG